MTLSTNSELTERFKNILGYDENDVEIAIESPSVADDNGLDNAGNISLSDFHKKPNFNVWIMGGAIALIFVFFGFFLVNRTPTNIPNAAQPKKENPDPLYGKPEDVRIGKLKTEVALSDQEQAMKTPTLNTQPLSPGSTSSRRPPVPPKSLPMASSSLPVNRDALSATPPVQIYRNAPSPSVAITPVAYRSPVHAYREVPSIRTSPPVLMPSKAKLLPKASPVSYQFGVPKLPGASDLVSPPVQSAPIPKNYQVYYPDNGNGPDILLDNYPQARPSESTSSVSGTRLLSSIPSTPSDPRSSAEQRFLEGRPRTRSISVGTQIFAQIFQATAVDNAQGYKILLRVSKPLVDGKGNQVIPSGTLIGATLQIGGGGVANVVPEILYLNERAISLPPNTIVVALHDGNPLVAERIERGGDRPGTNLIGLIVDTGATFLPMLSSGGNSDSFRDYYQFQRVTDYTNRNFGGDSDRRNYSQRQAAQPSVYFKLPPNLDIQLLVVAPFELPL